MTDRALSHVRRQHLVELTGPLGVWQHANGTVPATAHGYCTDDVARALRVDLMHGLELGWDAVRDDAWLSLAFLQAAYNPARGVVRNLRSAGGDWLDETGSEDCQGRALLALGHAAGTVADSAFAADAGSLFMALLPRAARLVPLRACASAILGCDAALDSVAGVTDNGIVRRAMVALATRLDAPFAAAARDEAWPWPEPILTYENALLPHGLLAAGRRLGRDETIARGLRVLDWLFSVQTRAGTFSPIGNRGWWPSKGERARFDQQPIEAAATVVAAAAALGATGDPRYRIVAEAAYGWFLGDNEPGLRLADPQTGGCSDGLSATEVNANQGAESTLAWLLALETMRGLRSVPPSADAFAQGPGRTLAASGGAHALSGAHA